MDEVTESVRNMYEKYPYPPMGELTVRVGSAVRLLLSYGRRSRPRGRPLNVLDAGCGRALGLLGAAFSQPDVNFVGVDMNRVALREAQFRAAANGIENVRFVESDLMTLDGLEIPEGGFDVVVSSGVLHHLSAPELGLAKLRSVIAPHGMLSVMVYGRAGREGLYRTVRALDLLVPRDRPLEERLDVARSFVGSVSSPAMFGGSFGDAAVVPDAEIVDRYLHVNEVSYDVRGFLGLLEGQGFKMVRWNEPELWDLESVLSPGPLRDRAASLTDLDRWALVEQIAERPMLDLVACTNENEPRPMPSVGELTDAVIQMHPEVSVMLETRIVGGRVAIGDVKVRRRRATLDVPKGPLYDAVVLLRDQSTAFRGGELVDELVRSGHDVATALGVLRELVTAEILYAPHGADV